MSYQSINGPSAQSYYDNSNNNTNQNSNIKQNNINKKMKKVSY